MSGLTSLPEPQAFVDDANLYLQSLSVQHDSNLSAGADLDVLHTTRLARTIRRATLIYAASFDIIPAVAQRESHQGNNTANYLRGLISRLSTALKDRNDAELETLVDAATAELDACKEGEQGVFTTLQVVTVSKGSGAELDWLSDIPNDPDAENSVSDAVVVQDSSENALALPSLHNKNRAKRNSGGFRSSLQLKRDASGPSMTILTSGQTPPRGGQRKQKYPSCFATYGNLSSKEKLLLWVYILLLLASVIPIAVVTVDFTKKQINPESFIRTQVSDSLPAPVVTICLSQRGIPFSRLQLYNFTDAQGVNFRGADPKGPQTDRQSPEFEAVVDRFWDNPGNEDCNKTVGDFYPFPLESLNQLTSGEKNSQCRPCYRVGRKTVMATSTDFRDSSILDLYTDNYFLQCMKSINTLDNRSLTFWHGQLNEKKKKMEVLGVLSSLVDNVKVADLELEQFEKIDSEQGCNIFYFGFFPKLLNTGTGGVDIKYAWDGSTWNPVGKGPYFKLKTTEDLLPEESLQMFVGRNVSTEENKVGENLDMLLLGPNTQTYASFQPVIDYDGERFDISSSTTNLRQDEVTPIFGYWLVYRVYYNFNRFVVEEHYLDSTYPAGQWFVDVSGYASLFTGASLLSLIFFPLWRARQRREDRRLMHERPEAYYWSEHKKRHLTTTPDMDREPYRSRALFMEHVKTGR